MTSQRISRVWGTILLTITIFSLSLPAYAQYSGGTGEPNDPYQIATAEDLIALGESPEDYDKHFILTADIDLDPNLPGGRVFDKAVIAPDTVPNGLPNEFQGVPFIGVFDGNGHRVSHLTITGEDYLGLFGQVGSESAEVRDLGVTDVNITGSGFFVGGLVGSNGSLYGLGGTVTRCYSTGFVTGQYNVGGLVGRNTGYVADCSSTGVIVGARLANEAYAKSGTGVLIGYNRYQAVVTRCHSDGTVTGYMNVGGLVGFNQGTVTQCYSAAGVFGMPGLRAGGLVGWNSGALGEGVVTGCFWDTQTSGRAWSDGGTGKTTAEMQTAQTFLDAGWDFVGETANGSEDIWKIAEGVGYPRLWWEKYSGGIGEPNDPYQIATAADLIALGETPEDYDKHFILTADIDLDPNLPGGRVFDRAVIAPDTDPALDEHGYQMYDGRPFTGVFDGDGHTISHLMIIGEDYLGLFGWLGSTAIVANLDLEAVEISGEDYVGGLVGSNDGSIHTSHASGSFSGGSSVGGLVGWNYGDIINCYSSGSVTGKDGVGGLVGGSGASITMSYSSGSVSGTDHVGGLVGGNSGSIATSYSNSSVNGRDSVGGLVGYNYGAITTSYSTGSASGESSVGGLVGYLRRSHIAMSYSSATVFGKASVGGLVGSAFQSNPGRGFVRSNFWDIETSGQTTSAWGWTTGKTTAEMQDPKTFMAAAWDFAGQPDGPHDIWAEPKGGGYPILWWQQSPLPELPAFGGGTGEPNNPYLISTAEDLNSIGHNPRLMKGHFRLAADLDLAGFPPYEIGDDYHPFDGIFDADGKTIRNLPRTLFGYVNGTIKRLRLVDPNCAGSPIRSNNGTIADCCVQGGRVMGPGGLVDSNYGSITRSYNTAALSGDIGGVGGLVRSNSGSITDSYSTGMVTSTGDAGGLVCDNGGRITRSFSIGIVIGAGDGGRVGGLVASNYGSIHNSYSLGTVTGIGLSYVVGGLIASNGGAVSKCYSTGAVSGSGSVGGLVGWGDSPTVIDSVWDVETSGLSQSAGGIGLTTAEMMDSYMLGLNGFANDPNWVLDAGRDYPHLAWEATRGDIIPEPGIDWLDGQGTEDKPFRIDSAEQLILIGRASIFWDKYLILGADIDLDPALPGRRVFGQALIQTFTGIFDGNGHTISHLTITGEDYLGLFGQLESLGEVKHLAMRDVSIVGTSHFAGGLLGSNRGRATQCYSTGSVSGYWNVGGLVGWNYGSIAASYSSSSVRGNQNVGGLAGGNGGAVSECYSTGAATGSGWSGGLLGRDDSGTVTSAFWDIQTSGRNWSNGGIGKTSAEMQTASTFLEAGWDFVDETTNGTEDIWWIDEGKDYPRLWWESEE